MLSGKAGPCCCGTIFKSAEPESGGHFFRLTVSKDRGTVGISILHCITCLVMTMHSLKLIALEGSHFKTWIPASSGKFQNESSNDFSMSTHLFIFSSSKILFLKFVWGGFTSGCKCSWTTVDQGWCRCKQDLCKDPTQLMVIAGSGPNLPKTWFGKV